MVRSTAKKNASTLDPGKKGMGDEEGHMEAENKCGHKQATTLAIWSKNKCRPRRRSYLSGRATHGFWIFTSKRNLNRSLRLCQHI